jgi:ABC-type uncharacterized transport system substrate-binding protein
VNNYSKKSSVLFSPLAAKLVLFFLLITPLSSYSKDGILAVMSDHRAIQQNFYSKLLNKLSEDTSVTQINASDITEEILSQHDLIISIGYKSAKVVAKHKTKNNVIYTLIPDNGSLQLSIPCEKTTCYKIYINQPVSRYVQLFKSLFPKGKTLVFATSNENSKKSQQVKTAAKNNNLAFKDISIHKNENISRTFINKLNNNDVLLALPNPDIYNANQAKSIILSTYHANVPIIAYSKSFAKAGALISLYSSIDNIAEKTANIVNTIITDGPQKQKEYYPDDFTIEINSAVARSLNINIDSENMLKRKIK